ncbi:MAG: DUF2911 domain-containing protein [Nitritalea sp.]
MKHKRNLLRNSAWACLLAASFFACGQEKVSESASEENAAEGTALSRLEEEHLLEKVAYADSVNAGLLEDTFKGSARREATGTIGNSLITVNYGSPGVRGRTIWNGLVSYDQVWVSGSHWATAVSFSSAVSINGKKVEPGMYGFFTVPGKEQWVLILNEAYDMHLAEEYFEGEDVIRLVVTPEILDEPVQRLTYEIETVSDTEGFLVLSWEKIRVRLPITGVNA